MIVGVEIENGSCDPAHALLGVACDPETRIDTVYLCAKLDNSS